MQQHFQKDASFALAYAVETGSLEMVEFFLSHDIVKLQITNGCNHALRMAILHHHPALINLLLNHADVFANTQKLDWEYTYYTPAIVSTHTEPFIDAKLQQLRNRHQEHINRYRAESFSLDPDEARLCFYMLRNLIARNTTNNFSADIRFLLAIPAIKRLVQYGLGVDARKCLRPSDLHLEKRYANKISRDKTNCLLRDVLAIIDKSELDFDASKKSDRELRILTHFLPDNYFLRRIKLPKNMPALLHNNIHQYLRRNQALVNTTYCFYIFMQGIWQTKTSCLIPSLTLEILVHIFEQMLPKDINPNYLSSTINHLYQQSNHHHQTTTTTIKTRLINVIDREFSGKDIHTLMKPHAQIFFNLKIRLTHDDSLNSRGDLQTLFNTWYGEHQNIIEKKQGISQHFFAAKQPSSSQCLVEQCCQLLHLRYDNLHQLSKHEAAAKQL